jgi:hypothetical protein
MRSAASNSNYVAEAGTNDGETVTDFIPLREGDSVPSSNNGQLMRVLVPRQALVSFGLPMNVERAAEPIEADLMVSADGVPRAIRFVR